MAANTATSLKLGKKVSRTVKPVTSIPISASIDNNAALAAAHVLSSWQARPTTLPSDPVVHDCESEEVESSEVEPEEEAIHEENDDIVNDDSVDLMSSIKIKSKRMAYIIPHHSNKNPKLAVYAWTYMVKSIYFDIPLCVPCGQTVKELSMSSDTELDEVLIAIAKTMVCDPWYFCLEYIFLWNEKGQKKVPMSLENEEEWLSMVAHVQKYLEIEGAKSKGKGPQKSTTFFVHLLEISNDSDKLQMKGQLSSNDADDDRKPYDSGKIFECFMGEICCKHYCQKCNKACKIFPSKQH
ncbi:hypothetical protein V8B97DRAFT_1920984 [Scleroderma yunnanense]